MIEVHASTLKERAKLAFVIARDEIQHSFDTGNQDVTISAEEALEKKEAICFAKTPSNQAMPCVG